MSNEPIKSLVTPNRPNHRYIDKTQTAMAMAPINIAIIKYMGKLDAELGANLPYNLSLSYASSRFVTTVECRPISGNENVIEIDESRGDTPLKDHEKKRFLAQAERLSQAFGLETAVAISSRSNFPKGCGLASSASSFSALTLSMARLADLQGLDLTGGVTRLSELSRVGSGSSCRSFYAPWSVWEAGAPHATLANTVRWRDLVHRVLVVESTDKSVSSSEAHQRVRTSPLYGVRPRVTNDRYEAFLNSSFDEDWKRAKNLIWDEWQEMHAMFADCDDSFRYMNDQTVHLLSILEDLWKKHGDGPWITLDAGPNIHLLFRQDQTAWWEACMQAMGDGVTVL